MFKFFLHIRECPQNCTNLPVPLLALPVFHSTDRLTSQVREPDMEMETETQDDLMIYTNVANKDIIMYSDTVVLKPERN